MKWTEITEAVEHSNCVVTNNMKAVNAFDNMSHVWMAAKIERAETEEDKNMCVPRKFFARESETFRKIYCVSHMLKLEPLKS